MTRQQIRAVADWAADSLKVEFVPASVAFRMYVNEEWMRANTARPLLNIVSLDDPVLR